MSAATLGVAFLLCTSGALAHSDYDRATLQMLPQLVQLCTGVPPTLAACNRLIDYAAHPIGDDHHQLFGALTEHCLDGAGSSALRACTAALQLVARADADALTARKIAGRLCAAGDKGACAFDWKGPMPAPVPPPPSIDLPPPPPLEEKCEGGELASCMTLVDTSGGDATKLRFARTHACALNDAVSCAALGEHAFACRLGLASSCDPLCIAGDLRACDGASDTVQGSFAASVAEHALPTLFARCELYRHTSLQTKKLAYECTRTLDELELAIEWATNVQQPRYGKLIAQMKARCGECPD